MAPAVDKALSEPFYLILNDMNMQSMDAMRRRDCSATRIIQKPIVALTANAMSGDSERCLVELARYQSKPIKPSRLDSEQSPGSSRGDCRINS